MIGYNHQPCHNLELHIVGMVILLPNVQQSCSTYGYVLPMLAAMGYDTEVFWQRLSYYQSLSQVGRLAIPVSICNGPY